MLQRQRTFEWDAVEFPKLERVDAPSGRYYVTPEGDHMTSVTSFLGQIGDKKGLEAWIKRLGVEAAEAEKKRAADRGTLFHHCIELYLQNDERWRTESLASPLFRQAKTVIDLCVGKVRAQEFMLYSNILKLAGTADLLAEWKGQLSIIDWKSSSKKKKIEWIDNYFMQACIYSLMLQERTGIKVENLVIVIGTESETRPSVFECNRRAWVPRVMTEIRKFHEHQRSLLPC